MNSNNKANIYYLTQKAFQVRIGLLDWLDQFLNDVISSFNFLAHLSTTQAHINTATAYTYKLAAGAIRSIHSFFVHSPMGEILLSPYSLFPDWANLHHMFIPRAVAITRRVPCAD